MKNPVNQPVYNRHTWEADQKYEERVEEFWGAYRISAGTHAVGMLVALVLLLGIAYALVV